jgi:hypothetical protein
LGLGRLAHLAIFFSLNGFAYFMLKYRSMTCYPPFLLRPPQVGEKWALLFFFVFVKKPPFSAFFFNILYLKTPKKNPINFNKPTTNPSKQYLIVLKN